MALNRRQFLIASGGVMAGTLVVRGLHVQAQSAPVAGPFRGAGGNSVQGPFTLNAGVTIIRGQHNGTTNFVVQLTQPTPGLTLAQANATAEYAETHLAYNEIGKTDGGVALIVGKPGSYYLDVVAGGAYQLSVEQPLPETAQAVIQSSFSGQGQQVTPYFVLPAGSYTVTAQADSNAPRLIVWLYTLDGLGGGAVSTNFDGRLIDADTPTAANAVTFTADTDATYILGIYTDSVNKAKWTVTVQ